MSKIKFREIRLSKSNVEKLWDINKIITEYQADGYILTLRQLYYQLVSRDIVPNKKEEYKKLSTLLKEGRMGGVVDWDAIEDRLRKPDKPSSFDSPKDLMKAAISQYQKPRQDGQPYYMEVWVEKDALSGVLSRVTRKYHIPIMVNRGYSSVSAMYDAFMRIVNYAAYQQIPARIIYLGDFDPSGLDMIRDISDRIIEFKDGYNDGDLVREMDFDVDAVALTMDQIIRYDPPPNPAKIEDPRAKDFIRRHGGQSWEVDALKPEVLNQILEDAIACYLDLDQYNTVVASEAKDKAILTKLMNKL